MARFLPIVWMTPTMKTLLPLTIIYLQSNLYGFSKMTVSLIFLHLTRLVYKDYSSSSRYTYLQLVYGQRASQAYSEKINFAIEKTLLLFGVTHQQKISKRRHLWFSGAVWPRFESQMSCYSCRRGHRLRQRPDAEHLGTEYERRAARRARVDSDDATLGHRPLNYLQVAWQFVCLNSGHVIIMGLISVNAMCLIVDLCVINPLSGTVPQSIYLHCIFAVESQSGSRIS